MHWEYFGNALGMPLGHDFIGNALGIPLECLWDDNFKAMHWEYLGNAFGTTILWENHGECMRNAWGMNGEFQFDLKL
jgi:hypothetical protein